MISSIILLGNCKYNKRGNETSGQSWRPLSQILRVFEMISWDTTYAYLICFHRECVIVWKNLLNSPIITVPPAVWHSPTLAVEADQCDSLGVIRGSWWTCCFWAPEKKPNPQTLADPPISVPGFSTAWSCYGWFTVLPVMILAHEVCLGCGNLTCQSWDPTSSENYQFHSLSGGKSCWGFFSNVSLDFRKALAWLDQISDSRNSVMCAKDFRIKGLA